MGPANLEPQASQRAQRAQLHSRPLAPEHCYRAPTSASERSMTCLALVGAGTRSWALHFCLHFWLQATVTWWRFRRSGDVFQTTWTLIGPSDLGGTYPTFCGHRTSITARAGGGRGAGRPFAAEILAARFLRWGLLPSSPRRVVSSRNSRHSWTSIPHSGANQCGSERRSCSSPPL